MMVTSASLTSSFFVPTVNPMKPLTVITQDCTVLFVAMNNSVKKFDEIDHMYAHGKISYHIDEHVIFTAADQALNLVAYN